MPQTPLLPAPAPVTVPTHADGTRFGIQLFTVESTSYGPYVGLPLRSLWTAYDTHLFTRETAEEIVSDLHRDECHMYGAFDPEDGTLTFEWTIENDGVGGRQVITPDQWGRYEIGGLWAWDEWQETRDGEPQPESARLYALGAGEYRQGDRSSTFPVDEAAAYSRGRMEAHALTLHLDDHPDRALNAALAPYGITTVFESDAGNSWLEVQIDQDREDGPFLLVDVMVEGEDWMFVDEPVGERRADWRVHRSMGGESPQETHLLTVPANEVERVAAYIADLLTAP
ncbi:hypothetical protein AB0H51_27940 [Streptomyces griseoluteus]|uniref:hypothetical protein n=1 Tax=Streptomyces griseoluteus TaxID=29306 RepID=UPI0033E5FC31